MLQRAAGMGEATALLSVTGRDVAETEMGLQFDDGKWSLVGSAEELRRGETERAIVTALTTAKADMSPAQVAKALGKRSDVIRLAMWRLAQHGKILNPARGLYRAP